MDLRYLNTFIQAAELGSFSRAAEQLGYSQPTISLQIKQLEQELGTRLFDRIGHTVRLTDKGRDLLTYAQRICHMCQEMEAQTSPEKEPRGIIRLATADSLCGPLFTDSLPGFRERHRHICLKVLTGGTGELFRLLDHNEADLVCTLDSHIYNASYVIAAEKRVGVHFTVSAENPLAGEKQVTLEALLTQPFVLTEKGMSYRRLLDEALARRSVEVQPVFETGRADIVCDMVERNIGISFLPDYVTEAAVTRGRAVRLCLPEFEPELWIQLLYHRDKWVSPQMQTVIDCLSGVLKSVEQTGMFAPVPL